MRRCGGAGAAYAATRAGRHRPELRSDASDGAVALPVQRHNRDSATVQTDSESSIQLEVNTVIWLSVKASAVHSEPPGLLGL